MTLISLSADWGLTMATALAFQSAQVDTVCGQYKYGIETLLERIMKCTLQFLN